MSATAALFALLAAVGMGLGSALLPFLYAEANAVVSARTTPSSAVALGVAPALAAGQTAGKLVLFESARRRSQRWAARDESSRQALWAARVGPWLTSPRRGPPVVLLSATLGVPSLAVVSLAAGACRQRRELFAVLVLTGRVRFAAIALPAAQPCDDLGVPPPPRSVAGSDAANRHGVEQRLLDGRQGAAEHRQARGPEQHSARTVSRTPTTAGRPETDEAWRSSSCLVAVHEAHRHRQPRDHSVPLGPAAHPAVGEVAERAAGAPEQVADDVDDLTDDAAVRVVNADDLDHGLHHADTR
ncbi:MAG: hypothetical protein ACJ714_15465 [Ornithinibacter sp.]